MSVKVLLLAAVPLSLSGCGGGKNLLSANIGNQATKKAESETAESKTERPLQKQDCVSEIKLNGGEVIELPKLTVEAGETLSIRHVNASSDYSLVYGWLGLNGNNFYAKPVIGDPGDLAIEVNEYAVPGIYQFGLSAPSCLGC